MKTKPSKISFFGTKRLMTLKLDIQHRVLKYNQIYLIDDTGLTWTILWHLFPNAFACIWHYSRYGLNPITLMLPVN